jgi:hypothetical protein
MYSLTLPERHTGSRHAGNAGKRKHLPRYNSMIRVFPGYVPEPVCTFSGHFLILADA